MKDAGNFLSGARKRAETWAFRKRAGTAKRNVLHENEKADGAASVLPTS